MRLYHYLEAKWALDDIRKRRLRVSTIDDLNDPYEFACIRSTHETSQRALDAFASGHIADYRVQCFSRCWNNILMWSHYAEKHKGICLGFDVPDECTRDVTYVAEVMLIGKLTVAQGNENDEILERLIWAKYDAWSYEQEVRATGRRINMYEEGENCFVAFGEHLKLREVILGARFSEDREVIEEALGDYSEHVAIIKAVRSNSQFEIVFSDTGLN